VKRHNESVAKSGFCPLCRRARSHFDILKIEKGMLMAVEGVEVEEVYGVF
jgi:hypothetical protein